MKILCGTDLLPKSSSALDRAGMLAVRLEADLTLLHVVAPTESEQLIAQDIQRACVQLLSHAKLPLWPHACSPKVRVRSGSVAQSLIETAKELDAGLVILGAHRTRPVRDALAGTVAERLLGELNCPVLIVKRMPWYAYRNILFALDGSQASAATVRSGESLVMKEGTSASVVHAYLLRHEDTMASAGIAADVIDEYADHCEQRARAELRDLLRQVSRDASRYEVIMENATTVVAVQKAVKRLNPDLLVLGTRGRRGWRRAMLGGVSNRLLSLAKSDVLVVPGRDGRGTWRNARAERLALDVVSGV